MNEDIIGLVITVIVFEVLYLLFGAILYLDVVLRVKPPMLRYNKDKPRHPSRIVLENIVNFFIRLLCYQFWIVYPLYLFVKWYMTKLKDYNESRGL